MLAALTWAALLYAGGQPPPADSRREIRIELTAAAERFGLRREDIVRQLGARLSRGDRSTADLGETLLTTRTGKLVRLSEVATIHVGLVRRPDRPAREPRTDGKIKSKVLTKALIELWPRLAAALGEADHERIPPLSPEILRQVTESTEAFWVTPGEEKNFSAGTFDDAYNAEKLAAVVREYVKYRGELPKGLAFLQRESRAGRLKGARLELMLRMTSDILREERQRARALAACPGGKKLSFRIAPRRAGPRKGPAPSQAEIDRYTKDLARNGPQPARKRGDRYAWFEATDHPDVVRGLISATYHQHKYVLLPQTTGPDAWGLTRLYQTTGADGKPAVGFELDKPGRRRFAWLTAMTKGMRLAFLVDDRALSTPRIREMMSRGGILAGRFSPHEARDLVWLLQAGMRPPAKGDRKDTKK